MELLDEELEVRKHKVNIKDEQLARLVCYHPSTDQMINYRIYTTPEGIVTKVEMEKKLNGKKVWVELSHRLKWRRPFLIKYRSSLCIYCHH